MLRAMRWSWVGLVVVMIACAGTPRPVEETQGQANGVTWVFRVLDPEGHPVSGARVSVWRADAPRDTALAGTTDAQGTGRIALMPGWYAAEIGAPGFVTTSRTDIRIAPELKPRMDLPLARAVPLSGRVVDTEGKPVRDVRLRFVSSNVATPVVQTTSDAQGRFTFQGAAAGEGMLLSTRPEWAWRRLKVTAPQPELTVVMGRGSPLLVRVLDTEGRAVPNATNILESVDRWLDVPRDSKQTPEGMVYLRLPPQRYRVTAGYAPAAGCRWDRTVDVEVLPGQQADVTVSFEGVAHPKPWTGQAVTPDGKPQSGLRLRAVVLESPEGRGLKGECETRTGPDGRFELKPHLARPHKLELRSVDGLDQVVGVAEQGASGPDGGPVVFQPTGALVGRVLQPNGQPLGLYWLQDWKVASHEGRFAWATETSRPYTLYFGAPDAPLIRLRFEGRAHEVRTVPDITLEPGHPVRGQVFLEDGRTGAPYARVEGVDPDDLEIPHDAHAFAWGATTDKEGRFQIQALPPRPRVYRVNAEQGGTALHEAGAREDPVVLRLTPDAVLEGFVTDDARVPLAGVTVQARCEAGLDTRTTVDEAGHYVLRIPGGRECFVHVSEEQLRDTPWPRPAPLVFSPQPVSLAPREHERRDFVPRNGSGALQVHFPQERERLEAFLVAGDVDMPKTYAALRMLQRSAFTRDPVAETWPSDDPELPGLPPSPPAFAFSQLPPGRYTFFAIDGLYGPVAQRVPVEVKQGETQPLRLGFPVDSGGTSFVP